MAQTAPRRGEVWIVDTGWQGKVRPCLVLSVASSDSDRELVTYIPRTTSVRGTAFEIDIDAPFFQRAGVFDIQGIATASRVKFQRRIGELTPVEMDRIELTLRHWLGMTDQIEQSRTGGLVPPPSESCPNCSRSIPLGEELSSRCEEYVHRLRPDQKRLFVYTCSSCGKPVAIGEESEEGLTWIYPPDVASDDG